MIALEREYQFYIDNHKELLKKYRGRVLVIKNLRVIATFDDEFEAIRETSEIHPPGTFLVKRCLPEIQVQKFHSRVSIA